MNITRLDKARDLKFKRQVEEESGQNLSACYQCGKCTAGCPGAQFYDRQVSQIMRAVQMGLKEEALKNRSLWLCLSCSTCSARCPNNIDVAAVMETLRMMARREGWVQDRPIESFWKAFLDTVHVTGRSYELGVMADYMAQGKSVRLDGLGTFRYTLATKGVETEAEFDFQKQVRAVRVQFIPTREGAQTKGSVSTRALVPTGIEWIPYDAALKDETEGSEPGGGTEPGGGEGGEDEDLFG